MASLKCSTLFQESFCFWYREALDRIVAFMIDPLSLFSIFLSWENILPTFYLLLVLFLFFSTNISMTIKINADTLINIDMYLRMQCLKKNMSSYMLSMDNHVHICNPNISSFCWCLHETEKERERERLDTSFT